MKRVTQVFPVFAVRGLDEVLAYYRDKLGFTVAWTWGQPLVRAGVRLDEIEIHLDGAEEGAPPGPSVIYCHMTGVEAYYQACRAQGALITAELTPRPWGVRDFRVVDPCGNRLGFAELDPAA